MSWSCFLLWSFTFYHGIHHFGRIFLLHFFQASWPRKSKEWGDQPDKPHVEHPRDASFRFRRQILLAPETDSHGLGLAPQCFAEILKREEMKEKTTFFFWLRQFFLWEGLIHIYILTSKKSWYTYAYSIFIFLYIRRYIHTTYWYTIFVVDTVDMHIS